MRNDDFTGHKFSFSVNFGKKNSLMSLPGLDYFARAVGVNTAPFGVFLKPLILSFARSAE